MKSVLYLNYKNDTLYIFVNNRIIKNVAQICNMLNQIDESKGNREEISSTRNSVYI